MQKILSRVIFIGFCIQIVLGALWMGNAFVRFTNPGEGIVCLGAMVLTGFSILFTKHSLWGRGGVVKEVFVVLSVLTFPFVMQSLVNPDYRLGIMIFALLGTSGVLRLMQSAKGMKRIFIILAFWLFVSGAVVGTESIKQGWTPMSMRLTERITWTTLYKSYKRMPDERKLVIDHDEFSNSTYEVLGIRSILLPVLVEDLGEDEAIGILKELKSLSWQYEKKQIVKEIIWDVAGYTVSPLILPLQLEGRAYESYSGMNYRELLEPNPKIGKIYTEYGCWWFGIALMASGLSCAENFIKRKCKMNSAKLLTIAGAELGIVVWYTMDGAGKMDYKNTLYILCIWLICMSGAAMKALSEEQVGGIRDEKE